MVRKLISLIALTLLAVGCTQAEPDAESDDNSRSQTPSDRKNQARPQPKHDIPAALERRTCKLPDEWIEYVYRGWDGGHSRAYDLALVPNPPNYMGSITDTSHSGPYTFLQEVPLLFYGPGHVRSLGATDVPGEVTIADTAPTVARMLGLDFPQRDAEPIDKILVPDQAPPKLIFTAVIDGGGWNVLDRWEGKWPHIKDLMKRGASVEGAVVGSSPSITPAIHTNLSTGAFPNRHKITAIVMRTDDGHLTKSFTSFGLPASIEENDPGANGNIPSVADLWDKSVNNEALVGMLSPGQYQYGMMGLSGALKGADKDFAAILDKEERWATNPEFYKMPGYVNDVRGPQSEIEAVDRSDGQVDGLWRGHPMPSIDGSPAMAPWENRTIQAMLKREGFGEDDVTDLFYVNYKAPDKAGHEYNMIAPEQGETIASVDDAVRDMIDWLDDNVGRGEYVFVLTADHGQTPLGAGGWPIRPLELTADLNARFDSKPNGTGLIQETSAATLFLSAKEMRANDVSPETVARFLLEYTFAENVAPGDPYPAEFSGREGERIFSAVVPGRLVDDVHAACV